MEFTKNISILFGIMFLLISSIHCVDYEKQCANIFLNNKTNHRLIISFCNESNYEQQQYRLEPQEHRSVRVSASMMSKLGSIKVFTDDPKPSRKKHKKGEPVVPAEKLQMKEIDYERNGDIVGLEIAVISKELDLKWRHSDEYAPMQAPSV